MSIFKHIFREPTDKNLSESVESETQSITAVDATRFVKSHMGPCVEITLEGTLISANESGSEFYELLQTDPQALQDLALLLARIRISHTGQAGRMVIRPYSSLINHPDPETEQDPGAGQETYDVNITPLTSDASRLVLTAKETTADANITTALAASRELYRDLVSCSTDFAWETDASGAFVFASKRGALGYTASELNGLRASDIVAQDIVEEAALDIPFLTNTHIEDVEVRLLNKDGEERIAKISAIPLYNKLGHWRGARGVGRDITELRAQEQRINRNRKREHAVANVLRALHSELEPSEILNAAARTILEATNAFRCYVYRTKEKVFIGAAEYCMEASFGHIHATKDHMLAGPEVQALASHLQFAVSQQKSKFNILIGDTNYYAAFTFYGGEVNGAVVIAKPKGGKAWTEDVIRVLEAIVDPLGIGVAQTNQIDALKVLSRKDPLTGRLNRRAFIDETDRRRHQHIRKNRPAALLYIDMDNFKSINDNYGHKAGDSALISLSRLLSHQVRVSDLLVRFGGDEFGIWLEETDFENATKKADLILDSVTNNLTVGANKIPMSISMGVAMFDPTTEESLESLIDRADQALYSAKMNGKKNWYLAEPYLEKYEDSQEGASC